MEVIVDLKKCCEKKYLMKVGVRNIGMKSSETMNIHNSFEEFSAERSKEIG